VGASRVEVCHHPDSCLQIALVKTILKLFGEGIRPRFSSKHIRLSRRKITLKELSAIFGFDNFAVEIAAPAFER
jgi:hypothetical protein